MMQFVKIFGAVTVAIVLIAAGVAITTAPRSTLPSSNKSSPEVPTSSTTSTLVPPRADPVVEDQIDVDSPFPDATVSSPLLVKGSARGSWFFEAVFPVRLEDANGKVIAASHAKAKSDWMTPQFIPFEARLVFSTPKTSSGTLILEKDNPSGLPQNAAAFRVPVKFAKKKVAVAAPCFLGGCSNQICSDKQGVMSTCEFTQEYACYKNAHCERQADRSCGWTQTLELTRCIQGARKNTAPAVY